MLPREAKRGKLFDKTREKADGVAIFILSFYRGEARDQCNLALVFAAQKDLDVLLQTIFLKVFASRQMEAREGDIIAT